MTDIFYLFAIIINTFHYIEEMLPENEDIKDFLFLIQKWY